MHRPYLHHNKAKDGQRKVSPPGPSYMSDNQIGSSAGRPLVQEPRMVPVRKNVSPTRVFSRPSPPSPNTAYRESYQRRFEKEQARSLRDALQEMDIQDDVRLHQAAQDEATELVWMHQNPGKSFKNPFAPYRNPDMGNSPQGLDKSNGRNMSTRSPQRNSHRPVSDYFSSSPSNRNNQRAEQQQPALDEGSSSPRKNGTLRKNLKVDFSLPQDGSPTKGTSNGFGLGLANISHDSSKGIFRNPKDQIYEEPEESQRTDEYSRPDFSRSDSSALKAKPRNALPRGSRPLSERFSSLPFVDKFSRFELHKHPPSQSRKPEYRINDPLPQANEDDEQAVPTKAGLEIRSDDIRAATSKRLKDRSTKLPMPTAVSDRAGRPIVSFDPSWKPNEAEFPRKGDGMRESASPTPPPVPAAPTIQVLEAPSIPVISLPDDKPPTISEMAGSFHDRKKDEKPLSTSLNSSRRPNPFQRKSQSSGVQNRWLSSYSRSGVPTAKCESCTLPISGKIVTAAGSRFHSECFVCHHCQTPLECVAFYQEPDSKRDERLADVPKDDEEAHLLSRSTMRHLLSKKMALHGASIAILAVPLPDVWAAKSQCWGTLSLAQLVVSGTKSALPAMNAVTALGQMVDISFEKASPKEQQRVASLEGQSS
ncbi:hypothetical protein BBP40_004483 [Aspergillus hancockii]|nr:hypothetical protein BBP40_004483 [Aspergillus hancockii]